MPYRRGLRQNALSARQFDASVIGPDAVKNRSKLRTTGARICPAFEPTMKPTVLASVLCIALRASAQQKTAPSGYYPHSYFGATFTGEVIDGPLEVLTLKYKKGNHEETFSGKFEAPCPAPMKDGKMGAMTPADVPLGTVVTVFYYGRPSKANDKSGVENLIIGISFDTVSGRIVPVEKRSKFVCTDQIMNVYKAFGGKGAVVMAPGPYQK